MAPATVALRFMSYEPAFSGAGDFNICKFKDVCEVVVCDELV